MPTPIENNTTALQALKVKAERLPDKTPPPQLQEKTVTPSTEVQEVVPDSRYDGLSKVKVEGYIDYSEDLKGLIDGTAPITKLPDGATKIRDYAFYKCAGLSLTALPESITDIGLYAFYNCENLALTSLPDGVTTINVYAFCNCTRLALTSLPNSVTIINNHTFYDCVNLALTTLPNNITSIGNYAFKNCTKLALTSLPEEITNIALGAFRDCTNLKKIWIPKGCITISGSNTTNPSFIGCINLTDIYTDAPSKPSGWGNYFNYTAEDIQATVHYNVTKAEFDAMFNTEYTITWYVGNATDVYLANLPKTYKGIDLPITVEDPVVGQLKFGGWSISGNLGQTSGTGTIKEGTYGDLEITAVWRSSGGGGAA